MAKVKLMDVLNSKDVLNKFMTKELPIGLSYKMSKILKVISNELECLEEQRVKLVREYGEHVPSANNSDEWRVKEDKVEEFTLKFRELLEQEVELDFEQIPISTLEKMEKNLSISPADLSKMNFVFV